MLRGHTAIRELTKVRRVNTVHFISGGGALPNMVGNNSVEQSLEESEGPTTTDTGVCNSFIEVNSAHKHMNRTYKYSALNTQNTPTTTV